MSLLDQAYNQVTGHPDAPPKSLLDTAYEQVGGDNATPTPAPPKSLLDTAYEQAMPQGPPSPRRGTYTPGDSFGIRPSDNEVAKKYKPDQCGTYVRSILQDNFGWKGGSISDVRSSRYATPVGDLNQVDTGTVLHLKADPNNPSTTEHWALTFQGQDGNIYLNELITNHHKGDASKPTTYSVNQRRTLGDVADRITGAWKPKIKTVDTSWIGALTGGQNKVPDVNSTLAEVAKPRPVPVKRPPADWTGNMASPVDLHIPTPLTPVETPAQRIVADTTGMDAIPNVVEPLTAPLASPTDTIGVPGRDARLSEIAQYAVKNQLTPEEYQYLVKDIPLITDEDKANAFVSARQNPLATPTDTIGPAHQTTTLAQAAEYVIKNQLPKDEYYKMAADKGFVGQDQIEHAYNQAKQRVYGNMPLSDAGSALWHLATDVPQKMIGNVAEAAGTYAAEHAPALLQTEKGQKSVKQAVGGAVVMAPWIASLAVGLWPDTLAPLAPALHKISSVYGLSFGGSTLNKQLSGPNGEQQFAGVEMAKGMWHRITHPIETLNNGDGVQLVMDAMMIVGIGGDVWRQTGGRLQDATMQNAFKSAYGDINAGNFDTGGEQLVNAFKRTSDYRNLNPDDRLNFEIAIRQSVGELKTKHDEWLNNAKPQEAVLAPEVAQRQIEAQRHKPITTIATESVGPSVVAKGARSKMRNDAMLRSNGWQNEHISKVNPNVQRHLADLGATPMDTQIHTDGSATFKGNPSQHLYLGADGTIEVRAQTSPDVTGVVSRNGFVPTPQLGTTAPVAEAPVAPKPVTQPPTIPETPQAPVSVTKVGAKAGTAAEVVGAKPIKKAGQQTHPLDQPANAETTNLLESHLATVKARIRDFEQRAARGEKIDYGLLEQLQSSAKGTAMQLAAEKRKLTGNLTPIEQAAAAKRSAANFNGKSVVVDRNGTPTPGIVIGNAFGKVRVKFESGEVISADPAKVTAAPALEIKSPIPPEVPKPTPKSSVPKADLDAALARLKAVAKSNKGAVGSGAGDFDPIQVAKDVHLVGKHYFESGITTAKEWTQAVVDAVGEHVRPFLDDAWKMLHPVTGDRITGPANARVDALRQSLGQEGIGESKLPPHITHQDIVDVGAKLIADGTIDPRTITGDHPLTSLETAVLAHEQQRLSMAIDKAVKALKQAKESGDASAYKEAERQINSLNDQLTPIHVADKAGGRLQGQAFGMRRILHDETYGLVNQLRQLSAVRKGEQTPEEISNVTNLVNTRETISKALVEHNAETTALQKQLAEMTKPVEDLKSQVADARRGRSKGWGASNEKYTRNKYDANVAVLKQAFADNRGSLFPKGGKRVPATPEQLAALREAIGFHVEAGAKSLGHVWRLLQADLGTSLNTMRDHVRSIYGEVSQEPRQEQQHVRLQKKLNGLQDAKSQLLARAPYADPLVPDMRARRMSDQVRVAERSLDKATLPTRTKGFVQRALDAQREAILMWPTTVAKILTWDLWQAIAAVPGRAIEPLVGQLPLGGGKAIRDIASTQGEGFVTLTKADLNALKHNVSREQFEAISDMIKTGTTRWDRVQGKQPSDLEFGGVAGRVLHGTFKTIAEIFGAEKSLYLQAAKAERINQRAIREGKEPPIDMMSQEWRDQQEMRAALAASEAKIMNPNKAAEEIGALTNRLRRHEHPGIRALGAFLQSLTPVKGVPLNIVGRVVRMGTGFPQAAIDYVKAVNQFRKTGEHITPEQADEIVKGARYGAAGVMAVLAVQNGVVRMSGLNYKNTNTDSKGDKMNVGEIEIAGHKLPPSIAHHPLVTVGQLFYTMTQENPRLKNRLDDVLLGLAEIREQLPGAISVSQLTKNPSPTAAAGAYLSGWIPGAVQWAARASDKAVSPKDVGWLNYMKADTTIRKPKTFGQELMQDLPGLRQQVPASGKPGERPHARTVGSRPAHREQVDRPHARTLSR